MPTAKPRMGPVPESQRLAAPKGIVQAGVDRILLGVSRTVRGESFEGYTRSGDVRAAKPTRAAQAGTPARRKRAEA